ncbi:hypothetical protein [Streptomyces wuyuanensis]|uniref:hypothetical protein n=1 Tax=Streptomyces wuyuanensis TaxID=1196353 RepID=UPI003F5420F1
MARRGDGPQARCRRGRRTVTRQIARAAAALTVAAASVYGTAGSAVAAPQPIGKCTTSSGVVLAVDFSHWGGPVYRSCGTTPTTGYELLNQGGWRTTGTGHDGPAFICRIGYSGHQGGRQYPTSREEDCVLTPPASAYWSYWHADPGENDWEYSQLGAMSYKPKPGSVDLWIFGGTNIEGTQGRPTVTPDQLRAHNTRPTGGGSGGRPSSKPADGGSAGQQDDPATRPPTTPPRTSAPPSASASPSPSASASSSPSTSPTPASASPSAVAAPPGGAKVVDAGPAADAEHDTGSILPVVGTTALVLLILGAASFAAKRRRRTE